MQMMIATGGHLYSVLAAGPAGQTRVAAGAFAPDAKTTMAASESNDDSWRRARLVRFTIEVIEVTSIVVRLTVLQAHEDDCCAGDDGDQSSTKTINVRLAGWAKRGANRRTASQCAAVLILSAVFALASRRAGTVSAAADGPAVESRTAEL